MAVRKPCGLKKPVIQKQLGLPSKIQAWNWRFRSSSSVNQNPRVLEAHDDWKQQGDRQTITWAKEYNKMLKHVIQVALRRKGEIRHGLWNMVWASEKKRLDTMEKKIQQNTIDWRQMIQKKDKTAGKRSRHCSQESHSSLNYSNNAVFVNAARLSAK